MTTFTQHARNRIEEFHDIDRRRTVYQPGSRHYAQGTGTGGFDPDIRRVGHVESPTYNDTIPCARVRSMMPMIEDLHFDPLFDGWEIPDVGLRSHFAKRKA
jgi:hypothetical protein